MAVVTTTTGASVAADLPAGRYVDWGPIIVGTLGALAIMVVLLTFGGALGLSVTSAQPYAGLSAKALAVLAGLYAALVHVASFGAGGYLAGRLRTPWVTSDTVESHFRDGGHGFAVWALGVVLGAVFAFSGVSAVLKTAVGATTAVASAGVAGAAANPQTPGALQQLSTQPTDYAVDRLLAPGPGGAAAPAGGPAPGPAMGSRADLAAPIARAFCSAAFSSVKASSTRFSASACARPVRWLTRLASQARSRASSCGLFALAAKVRAIGAARSAREPIVGAGAAAPPGAGANRRSTA